MNDSSSVFSNVSWLPAGSTLTVCSSVGKTMDTDKIGKTTAVFAFLFDKDHNIILIKHNNPARGFDLPGGHIEYGETEQEALEREVLEETGYSVKDVSVLGYQVIEKTVAEDKYPDLLSNQAFYVAYVDSLVTTELAPDSDGVVIMPLNEYDVYINSKDDTYYKKLFSVLKTNFNC